MTEQCSNCYFGRLVPASTGLPSGSLSCQVQSPNTYQSPILESPGVVANAWTITWPWPIVQPDYWCGEYQSGSNRPTTLHTVSITSDKFTIPADVKLGIATDQMLTIPTTGVKTIEFASGKCVLPANSKLLIEAGAILEIPA